TDLFLRLLGVRMEDAVHIAKASLAFHGGVSWGWFVLLLLALAALIWWFYRNSPVHITGPRKVLLATLRIAFIALLLLLLVRPVLSFTVEGSVRRLLVLLVDSSSSMRIKDPRIDQPDQKRAAIALGEIDPAKGLTQSFNKSKAKLDLDLPRIDLVKATLKNDQLNLLPQLDKEFDLEAYTFAQGVAGIASRRETTTNASPREASKHVTTDQFTWV